VITVGRLSGLIEERRIEVRFEESPIAFSARAI
jgi:hypothetical protein